MNIPGSIEAELKAAREEGRREGLREAIAICKEMESDADAASIVAYNDGTEDDVACFDDISEALAGAQSRMEARLSNA